MPKDAAEKKRKTSKDSGPPKKPSGAYIHFCQAKRAEVKEAHPDFSLAQVGRKLGELWRNETPESKKPYYELAQKDKERYTRDFATYTTRDRNIPAPKPATTQ